MTTFNIAIDIQASPERVWAVMSDLERWPEWTSSISSVQRLDQGPVAIGSRAKVRQPKLLPTEWEITEWSPGAGFTWVTRRPGVAVVARHTIEAIENGSRVTLTLQFQGFFGPLIARLTRSINDRYLAMEANGLKARSEAPVPAAG